MILYVESNFVLELAFLREEHDACLELLQLATAQKVNLVLPAFSIGEPYEAWVRRANKRRDLHEKLTAEIRELARSKPYRQSSEDFLGVTELLTKSGEEEKHRLDETLNRILNLAEVIPIDLPTIKTSINLQKSHGLSPQDSIVFASVLAHLKSTAGKTACFITKNSRDFSVVEVKEDLVKYNCKILFKFSDGLGYVQSQIPISG
ncbi:MAG: PIN domain-containing protein [Acidobacteriota bacterium]